MVKPLYGMEKEGLRQVFPVLMLLMLCVGLVTLTIKVRPARADGTPAPLSATITPYEVWLVGGQSQIFNSSVTGGSPPYTYQWYIETAHASDTHPISGATNPTYNFTAPLSPGTSWIISLSVNDSAGTQSWPWCWVSETGWEPIFHEPVFYSVEPVPVAPLANANASINGLETPPVPSPVGENFMVEIHLMNATATNVPAGVLGVEVHFYFGNILDYCKPIGFTNELGQPDGALRGPVIYAVNGFYNDDYPTEDNVPLPPPYTGATQYVVAAGSNGGPWNGNDSLVAKITFQITGQPSQNMSQPDFYAPLQISFGDLLDNEFNHTGVSGAQGTLRIDASRSLVGDLNGDGKVDLGDLIMLALAYGATPSSPNWNPDADLNHDGVINLIDLVTLASHYGQHSP